MRRGGSREREREREGSEGDRGRGRGTGKGRDGEREGVGEGAIERVPCAELGGCHIMETSRGKTTSINLVTKVIHRFHILIE